jgi:hypothetical protein
MLICGRIVCWAGRIIAAPAGQRARRYIAQGFIADSPSDDWQRCRRDRMMRKGRKQQWLR